MIQPDNLRKTLKKTQNPIFVNKEVAVSFPIAVIDGVEPPSSAGHANLIFAVNFHPTRNILILRYSTVKLYHHC